MLWVCVSIPAVVTRHENRVYPVSYDLPSVTCTALPYILTLAHTRHDFGKNIIDYEMCIFISSRIFAWNFSHFKKNSARCHKYIGPCVKYPFFLSYLNEIWIFSTCFWKILKYQISWKSVQWKPSSSMRTDHTQIDMTKQIVALRNFANAATNGYI
jgi:hypothetical protein